MTPEQLAAEAMKAAVGAFAKEAAGAVVSGGTAEATVS